MSQTAVYHVTRSLRRLLYCQLVRAVSTAVVSLHPPGETLPEVSGINLYLYRVTESPSTKNRDWPGDRRTPPGDAPALGLVLSYLLTPLAQTPDDASVDLGDDAHTMLGIAMSTFAAYPILNNVHIPPLGTTPNSGFDADTVLAAAPALLNSYEQIKITLLPTSLDELSKIWATINQPYRLSVAYEVSIVQIPPSQAPPANGKFVQQTGLAVAPIALPTIGALVPAGGALSVVGTGNALVAQTLQIRGSGFAFGKLVPNVTVGGTAVTFLGEPTATAIAVSLPLQLDGGPSAAVAVGVGGRVSAQQRFLVNPWLAQLTPIRTGLAGTSTLQLNGTGFTTAARIRLDGPDGGGVPTDIEPLAAGATDGLAVVTLPATLANGLYDVRLVRTDGVTTNPASLEVIPLISAVSVTQVVVTGTNVSELAVTGARLTGTFVTAMLDGTPYLIDPPTITAAELRLTLGRLLSSGAHTIAVTVDGHVSHTVAFTA